MLVTCPPELLVALHGKFEPSAFRGLLSGLPYGGGVAIIMWPWVVEAKSARAEKERINMIEGILWLGAMWRSFVPDEVFGIGFDENNMWLWWCALNV